MDLAPHVFQDLATFIRGESGIVLGPDKAYLAQHRLEPLIRAEGLGGFDVLMSRLRLRSGSALRSAVVDAITVKETQFFRDPSCFEGLLRHVLPSFAEAHANAAHGRKRMRLWSAAAATGQEAYSLAMLVNEFAATNADGPKENCFSIVASDISTAAVAAAKAGRYSESEVHRGLSTARLQRHLHQRGAWWHINESLRQLVHFRTFNLLGSPAELGAFDLILCRNVLIYFDDPTRRKICRALYAVLQPGGWLALGAAESLYGMEERFESLITGKSILYRKPRRPG